MLKLSDRNFKAAIINMPNEIKENMFIINEKVVNLSREIGNTKRTKRETQDWKIKNLT